MESYEKIYSLVNSNKGYDTTEKYPLSKEELIS
jgi:hypothetical protein